MSLTRHARTTGSRAFFALLLMALIGFSSAAAPAALPQPLTPTVAATDHAGAILVNWSLVAGARFYTVGWVNARAAAQAAAGNGDWRNALHYATLTADTRSYVVSGLHPGEVYWVLVGARTTRFGGAEPVWSPWAGLVVPAVGQPGWPGMSSERLALGDSITLALGTFTLTGVSPEYDAYYPPLGSGRRLIAICGDWQNTTRFTGWFHAGTDYQVVTDAGVGFVATYDQVRTAGAWEESGENCETWEVPAMATKAVVAVFNSRGLPFHYLVELPAPQLSPTGGADG